MDMKAGISGQGLGPCYLVVVVSQMGRVSKQIRVDNRSNAA